MRRRTRFRQEKPQMTAMIDVTFLLLIFFLVTLNFRTLEGRLDSALPRGEGVHHQSAEPIEKLEVGIRVLRPGELVPDPATATRSHPMGRLRHYQGRVLRYEVGTRTFPDLDGLRSFLRGWGDRKVPIRIHPLGGTIYADVVPVLDVVIQEGFGDIAFTGAPNED